MKNKIQQDLNNGMFYKICSNETTFKEYIFPLIDQAIEEEREKVEDMRNSLPPYPADKENPMKHMYQNEGYSKALDDILSQR